MHGRTEAAAPWGTVYWALSNLRADFLGDEAAEPGVEEEYPNFIRTFFFLHTRISFTQQRQLGLV